MANPVNNNEKKPTPVVKTPAPAADKTKKVSAKNASLNDLKTKNIEIEKSNLADQTELNSTYIHEPIKFDDTKVVVSKGAAPVAKKPTPVVNKPAADKSNVVDELFDINKLVAVTHEDQVKACLDGIWDMKESLINETNDYYYRSTASLLHTLFFESKQKEKDTPNFKARKTSKTNFIYNPKKSYFCFNLVPISGDLFAAKNNPDSTFKHFLYRKNDPDSNFFLNYCPGTNEIVIDRTVELSKLYSKYKELSKNLAQSTLFVAWPFVKIDIQDKKLLQNYEFIKNLCGPLLLWKASLNTSSYKTDEPLRLSIVNDKLGSSEFSFNIRMIKKLSFLLKHVNPKRGKNPIPNSFQILYEGKEKNNRTIEQAIKFLNFELGENFVNLIKNDLVNLLNNPSIMLDPKGLETFKPTAEFKYEVSLVNKKITVPATIGIKNCAGLSLFYFDKLNILGEYDYLTSKNDFIDYVINLKLSNFDTINYLSNIANFNETEICSSIPLDYYQQSALYYSLNHDVCIIGGPGTGKTQVVSGMVNNNIMNGHSTLVTSERFSAIDNLYERLGSLKRFVLRLKPSPNLKYEFTDQIRNNVRFIANLIQASNINTNNKFNMTLLSPTAEMEKAQNSKKDELDELISTSFLNLNRLFNLMNTRDGSDFPTYQERIGKVKKLIGDTIQYVYKYVAISKSEAEFWDLITSVELSISHYDMLSKWCKINKVNDETLMILFDAAKVYNTVLSLFDKELVSKEAFDKLFQHKSGRWVRKLLAARVYDNDEFAAILKRLNSSSNEIVEILKNYDYAWYLKASAEVHTKEYNAIHEFCSKFTSYDIDYESLKRAGTMYTFQNKHIEEFKINDKFDLMGADLAALIREKLNMSTDLIENSVLHQILHELQNDEDTYEQFNSLYLYFISSECIDDISIFLKTYGKALSVIFPVIVTTPNFVCRYITCIPEIFDNLIIDEASQMTIATALPLLYRAKSYAIVGDSKQLPPQIAYIDIPTKEFAKESTSVEDSINKINEIAKSSENNIVKKYKKMGRNLIFDVMSNYFFDNSISLLDTMSKKFPTIELIWNYRSASRALLAFNNAFFYSDILKLVDSPIQSGSPVDLVEFSDSKFENGINKKEADAVVKTIEQIVSKPNHGSIGVIVATPEQRDYIESLIFNHKSQIVVNELNRRDEEGSDISLFVKTILDVQGDERDNILLSFCFSKNGEKNTNIDLFWSIFNFLKYSYGNNFLNVIFSRTKQRLHIYKSFKSDDVVLNDFDEWVNPIFTFKKILSFFETMKKTGSLTSPEMVAIINEIYKNKSIPTRPIKISDFHKNFAASVKKILAGFIDKKRYVIEEKHVQGDVVLDLVVRLKNTDCYAFGIFCENFYESKDSIPKIRHFYSRNFLNVRSWPILTITSLSWCQALQQKLTIDKIKSFCKTQTEIFEAKCRELKIINK